MFESGNDVFAFIVMVGATIAFVMYLNTSGK